MPGRRSFILLPAAVGPALAAPATLGSAAALDAATLAALGTAALDAATLAAPTACRASSVRAAYHLWARHTACRLGVRDGLHQHHSTTVGRGGAGRG